MSANELSEKMECLKMAHTNILQARMLVKQHLKGEQLPKMLFECQSLLDSMIRATEKAGQ